MSSRSLTGLALALAAFLTVPAAQAQLIPSLDIGVAGGVNFASLGDAGSVDFDQSTGYHVGVYADVGVLLFSARTGLFYVSAGDVAGAGENGEDGRVRYIAVPLDFQIQTPTPIVKGYVLAGPEVRFPLQGLDTFDRESLGLAANIGIGVKGGVPLIGPSGFLELRYGFDLSGFGDSQGDDIVNNVKVNLFMIRAGIGI